uniref:Uncharacterized protein n=1 Tax=Panagrolaimus sp. PS1159 TaxID=55785 RepID=A0AC35F8W5_9BILA
MVLSSAEMHKRLCAIFSMLYNDLQTPDIDFRRTKQAMKYIHALIHLITSKEFELVEVSTSLKANAAQQIFEFFNKFTFNTLAPLAMFELWDEIIVSRLDAEEKACAFFLSLLQLFVTQCKNPNTLDGGAFKTLFSSNLKFLGDACNNALAPVDFIRFASKVEYKMSEELNFLSANGDANRIGSTRAPFTNMPANADDETKRLFKVYDGMRVIKPDVTASELHNLDVGLDAIAKRDKELMFFKYGGGKNDKKLKSIFSESRKAVSEVIRTLERYDQKRSATNKKFEDDVEDFLHWLLVPAQQEEEQRYFKFKAIDYAAQLDDMNVRAAEKLKNPDDFQSVTLKPPSLATNANKLKFCESVELLTKAELEEPDENSENGESDQHASSENSFFSTFNAGEEPMQFVSAPSSLTPADQLRVANATIKKLKGELDDALKAQQLNETYSNEETYKRETAEHQRLQSEITGLKAELDTAKEKVVELQQDGKQLEKVRKELQAELDEANGKIERLEANQTDVEKRLDEKELQINSLQQQITQKTREHGVVQAQLDAKKGECVKLEKQLKKKDAELLSAKSEVAQKEAALKDALQKVQELNAEAAASRAPQVQAEAAASRAPQVQAVNEEEDEDAKDAAVDAIFTNAALEGEVAVLKMQLDSTGKEKEELQQELANVQKRLAEKDKQLEDARSNVERLQHVLDHTPANQARLARGSSVPAEHTTPRFAAPAPSQTFAAAFSEIIAEASCQVVAAAAASQEVAAASSQKPVRSTLEGVYDETIANLTDAEKVERQAVVDRFVALNDDPACCRKSGKYYLCSNMDLCRGAMWYHRFCAAKAFYPELIDEEAKDKYQQVQELITGKVVWFCKICEDAAVLKQFEENNLGFSGSHASQSQSHHQ